MEPSTPNFSSTPKSFRRRRIWLEIPIALILLAILAILVVNMAVVRYAEPYMVNAADANPGTADCILVLGAKVYDQERLSPILQDRMDIAIALYRAGKADRLLLSGDHGQTDYDEVNAMYDYALEQGVPGDDVFLDHAGFCTYDSLYRARDVFCVKSMIIVTQQFHISRALYIARQMGLTAYGVHSDPRVYSNATYDAIREMLARTKDYLNVNILKPKPKYLGEKIPITGVSALTHDKEPENEPFREKLAK